MPQQEHRFTPYDKDYLEPIPSIQVKHKDYFNMKYLYTLMHEWLVEEDWCSRDDSSFPEAYYLQRESQKSGTELWIRWRLQKNPVNNQYWLFLLDLDIHVILLKEAEIVHEGVKYKANWGEPEIVMTAKILADANNKWKTHPFLKNIHKLYWKRIFKRDFEKQKKDLYHEVYRLQEAIKTYLKIQTYLPEAEGQEFWQKRDEPG